MLQAPLSVLHISLSEVGQQLPCPWLPVCCTLELLDQSPANQMISFDVNHSTDTGCPLCPAEPSRCAAAGAAHLGCSGEAEQHAAHGSGCRAAQPGAGLPAAVPAGIRSHREPCWRRAGGHARPVFFLSNCSEVWSLGVTQSCLPAEWIAADGRAQAWWATLSLSRQAGPGPL